MNIYQHILDKANQPWTKKDSKRMAKLIEKRNKYYNKQKK